MLCFYLHIANPLRSVATCKLNICTCRVFINTVHTKGGGGELNFDFELGDQLLQKPRRTGDCPNLAKTQVPHEQKKSQ